MAWFEENPRVDGSQTNQGEVLDGGYYMTFTPKVTLLQLPLSLSASSAKRRICRRGASKGTLNRNLVKNLPTQGWKTEEENWGINENILAS